MSGRPGSRSPLAVGDRYPRVAAVWQVATRVLGAVWLLVVLVGVGGFLLGSPGPADDAPAIDFDEEPAMILATVTERLDYRDYTVEEWVRTTDYETGGVSGGMFYRLHVESSRGQVRGQIQPARSANAHGIVGDRPVRELFVTDGAAWARLAGRDYWQRSEPARGLAREVRAPLNTSAADFEDAAVTVVADNETTYVVSVDPGPDSAFARTGSLRYVVAKGDDPHLQRIRHVDEGRKETTTRVIRLLDYGEAIAIRPAEIPSTSGSELLARVTRGLHRLA